MKKFSFPLDRVLDFKQQQLESAQAEHAAAIAAVTRQEEYLEGLWQEYRAYNEEFCRNKAEGLRVTEAILYESQLRAMEVQIQRETEELAALRRQEEEKRAAVVEKRKETASLEKLRERKLDLYQKAVQKSEEAFIEEFVSNSRATAVSRSSGSDGARAAI